MKKRVWAIIKLAVLAVFLAVIVRFVFVYFYENNVLKSIIKRLEADSRIAEVIVSGVKEDPASGKTLTTIKFLEYDSEGKPLGPKYFTFTGNIIQFQSLVVRFEDIYVRKGDRYRGKSAYIFWKVFMLDGANTQEYDITKMNEIPLGYKLGETGGQVETRFWQNFWTYALNPEKAASVGVKNAQIEAPGTKFVPGIVYTLKIEHDGGIRIDSSSIPQILIGEKIPEP